MKTQTLSISPWGNSHGVRLSRSLMEAVGIGPESELEAVIVGPGRLELRARKARLTLAQKLKQFDPAVHGGELMASAAVGAEFGAR